MRWTIGLLSVWTMLVGHAWPVHAQDAKLSVTPVAVAVMSSKFDADAFEMSRPLGCDAPVAVALLVKSNGPSIIGLNGDDSAITTLRDDQGSDLLKADQPTRTDGFMMSSSALSPFPDISKDQKQVLIEVRGGKAPAVGSKAVTLKGTLVLKTATGTETVKVERVALQLGKLPAGVYDVSIIEAGPNEWVEPEQIAVTFQLAGEAGQRWADITFKDSQGQALEARQFSTLTMFDKVQVQYALPKTAKAVTVELTLWTGFESVKLPVDATIGLGL
jgi:hypothetical protein